MLFTTVLVSFNVSFKDFAVLSAIETPLSTAIIEFSISILVFFAASALFSAKFRTSSATTAKPFP